MSSTFISALVNEIDALHSPKSSFLNVAITPTKEIRPFVIQQEQLPLPIAYTLCNIVCKIEPKAEFEARQMMLKRAIQDIAKEFNDEMYGSIPESEKRE